MSPYNKVLGGELFDCGFFIYDQSASNGSVNTASGGASKCTVQSIFLILGRVMPCIEPLYHCFVVVTFVLATELRVILRRGDPDGGDKSCGGAAL